MSGNLGNIFGSVSQDHLPPGYGDIPSKEVVRIGQPEPNPIFPEQGGLFPEEIPSAANPAPQPNPAAQAPAPQDDAEYRKIGDGSLLQGILSQITGGTAPTSVDVGPDASGYKYRIHSDGHITVLSKGSKTLNKDYAADSDAAANLAAQYPAEFASVTAGPAASTPSILSTSPSYSSSKVERGAAIGAVIGAAAQQLIPTLAALLGQQEITPFDEEFVDVQETSAPATSGAPWGLIIGGVAVVGVLGTVIFMVTRGDDEE